MWINSLAEQIIFGAIDYSSLALFSIECQLLLEFKILIIGITHYQHLCPYC